MVIVLWVLIMYLRMSREELGHRKSMNVNGIIRYGIGKVPCSLIAQAHVFGPIPIQPKLSKSELLKRILNSAGKVKLLLSGLERISSLLTVTVCGLISNQSRLKN